MSYEEQCTKRKNLTFKSAKSVFEQCNVDFSEGSYPALGITQESSPAYTNLALLLSEQCSHSIKVAVFADKNRTIFKDMKEFTGSLFKQLDNAATYLALCNSAIASFDGQERIYKRDYPEEAIREALLNALVHRDYSYGGSIIVNVNDDAMEFISIGGIPEGLSTEDIKNGIYLPRNPKLLKYFID